MLAHYQIYKANVSLSPIKITNEAEIEQLIKDTIHAVSGFTYYQYVVKTRKREIVQVRQLFHYLLNDYTRLSLNDIGMRTGSNHHSTIIHSINTIKDFIEIKEKIGKGNSFTNIIETCINILDSKIKKTWQQKQKQ